MDFICKKFMRFPFLLTFQKFVSHFGHLVNSESLSCKINEVNTFSDFFTLRLHDSQTLLLVTLYQNFHPNIFTSIVHLSLQEGDCSSTVLGTTRELSNKTAPMRIFYYFFFCLFVLFSLHYTFFLFSVFFFFVAMNRESHSLHLN